MPLTFNACLPSPPPRRTRATVPVYIRESHNDILGPLLGDFGRGFLPMSGLTFVHFDAHADLSVPPQFPAAQCRDRVALLNAVSIADWLLPLVYLGVISRVVWLKPSWAGQMPDGEHEVYVGAHARTGMLAVSSSLDYYTEELAVSREDLEGGGVLLSLCVVTVDDPCSGAGDAGASSGQAPKVPERASAEGPLTALLAPAVIDVAGHVVLDVCLDFFSTVSPWQPRGVSEADLAAVRTVYFPAAYRSGTPGAQGPASLTLLSARKAAYAEALGVLHAKPWDPAGRAGYLSDAEQLAEEYWADPARGVEAFARLFEFVSRPGALDGYEGEFHDSAVLAELPVHVSNEATIAGLMGVLGETVAALPRVLAVTVARSGTDGYTPMHQVDGLEAQVLRTVEDRLGLSCSIDRNLE